MKRVLQGAAAIVLGALVALLAVAVRDSSGARSFAADVRDGGRPVAPTFELPALDGSGPVRLDAFRGRPVVVNFWASWCDPCKDEAPLFEQLARSERERGVAFVGVDSQDLTDDARSFARRYGLSYTLVRDRDDRTKRDWGVQGFPETFVLDRGGRAVAHFNGPIDASAATLRRFEDALAAVRE